MHLLEHNFLESLKKEMEKRFYTFIEPMKKEGSWGVLFKFYSKTDDKPRVIKVYKEPINESNLKIYESDALKLKKFQHENIVKSHGTGIVDYKEKKYFFIILDYIEGKALDEINPDLFKDTPFSKRIETLAQALETIGSFREKFEMHNDLHLGNLMYSDNRIIIIDFGVSIFVYKPPSGDYDLYEVKNELIEFILRKEEIQEIFKEKDLKSIEFGDLKKLIKRTLKKVKSDERKFPSELILKTQAFFNRLATFLADIAMNKLSSSDIKQRVQDFRQSEEKSFFGIEVTQQFLGHKSKISFLNQKYILRLISDYPPKKELKINSNIIELENLSVILALLKELKHYIIQHYGIEISFPYNFKICEVELDQLVAYINNRKMLGTEHLDLRIKNRNNYPIKLKFLGIAVSSLILIYERDIEVEANESFSIQIPESDFKSSLEKRYIEIPCKIRGCAKLDSGEIFYSRTKKFQ